MSDNQRSVFVEVAVAPVRRTRVRAETDDQYDDEWNLVRSDWITEQKLSVYFSDNQWVLVADQIAEIRRFANQVANDIRTN